MLKAILIGNLGNDPEDLRYTADGRAFVRFNVASNYRAKGQDGEWQDRTEWVRVTAFGRQAEMASQYLRKGSKVYVDGRLEARPWTDNQSQPRAGLEVIANDIQFMSSRADDERGEFARSSAPAREAPAGASGRPSGQAGQSSRPAQSPRSGPADDADLEDLPF